MEIASNTVQDEYLTLLVSQLRNQDPLEPVSQEDFISQVAQFQSLESIERLNASFSTMLQLQSDLLNLQEVSLGADLIGKMITYRDANDEGAVNESEVTGFQVADGRLQLVVEGSVVDVDQLISLT